MTYANSQKWISLWDNKKGEHFMLLLPFLFVIRYIYPDNILMYSALLLYMSAPPSFGMQSYIETEDPGKFVVAANSLYMIITLGVYVFISVAYVRTCQHRKNMV